MPTAPIPTPLKPSTNPSISPRHQQNLHRFGLTVPKQFALGSYFMVSEVDPLNSFHESDATNNTSTAVQALAIVSPFPPVAASFTLSDDNTKGPNKGELTIINTNSVVEASDGTLSGDAVINSITGTLTGNITTAGNLTLHISVNGIIQTMIGTVKGDKFTGTFVSNDGDGGSVTSLDI